jgi:hypothetical protein
MNRSCAISGKTTLTAKSLFLLLCLAYSMRAPHLSQSSAAGTFLYPAASLAVQHFTTGSFPALLRLRLLPVRAGLPVPIPGRARPEAKHHEQCFLLVIEADAHKPPGGKAILLVKETGKDNPSFKREWNSFLTKFRYCWTQP